MELNEAMLRDFRKAYRQMVVVRARGTESEIRNAERNFLACAKILAKRVPAFIKHESDWPRSSPAEMPN